MTGGIDFGKTACDYAKHRPGHPEEDFELLRRLGVGRPRTRVLDLGTGTGQMARGLARGGAEVVGLDPAGALLAASRGLDRPAGVATEHIRAKAETLPFADASFDGVTAAQCWHWFDGPLVAAEVRRVLRPGGPLALVHLDWLPLPGSVVEATEALILHHNPDWKWSGGDGRYPQYVEMLTEEGFANAQAIERDLDLAFSHEAWLGRIRASAGVAASLSPAAVDRFDADHAALLAERFPANPLAVPHRVFIAVGQRP